MIAGTDARRQFLPCFASLAWRAVAVLLVCGGLEVAAQDVCASSTRVKSFTLNTASGLAQYTLQQDLLVADFASIASPAQGVCSASAPASATDPATSIAVAAVLCLLGGIAIGIVADVFLIPRLFGKKSTAATAAAAAADRGKGDRLAESIVRNPYESSTERVTFNNPAFHSDTTPPAASDLESGANSGSSRNSPVASKPALAPVSVGRQSSVQWPQWTGSSGAQGAIKKQWRDSVTSVASTTTDDVEAGLIGEGSKRRNWFLGLFKKRPNVKVDVPDVSAAALAEAVPLDEGVLPVTEMSAIMDDIDQLARDIDDMPATFPGQAGALAAAAAEDAVDLAAAPLQVSAPPLPPTPDMSHLDELVERPHLPAPMDNDLSLAAAGKAAESKIALAESLSAASSAMPKFEHMPLESKSSTRLQTNPFLKGDKKKAGVEVKASEKRKSGSDLKKPGIGHLAEKFKQEEGTFKRPSLRSVSSKSSDSSKSDPSATPTESQLGQQQPSGFPKVSLRRIPQGVEQATTADSSSSSGKLQQAMSALKKTAPELRPSPPPQESKPQLPPHLPEPLPTESQVDMMEEEDGDLYIDPEAVPMPRSPSAVQDAGPNAFDLSAATMSADNYLTGAEPAAIGQEEDYIDMAESAPAASGSFMAASQPPAAAAAPRGGYMQLADAVTGDNSEYLDMTGTLPRAPQVAKRKISQGKAAVSAKAAGTAKATATAKVAGKKAQKKATAKEKKKTGFFGRLFSGGKAKAKASAAVDSTDAQKAALSRLRPGWRVASKSTSSVKADDLPLPAPPEWVQQLHKKGRQVYDDDGIYEEYVGGEEDNDLYEELNTSPRQHTVDKISKPSEGRVLITAHVREQAIEDLKSTPMPAGNVKRLTSHWVKKNH